MQMVMFTIEKESKRFFVRDVSIRRVLLNEGSPTCISPHADSLCAAQQSAYKSSKISRK